MSSLSHKGRVALSGASLDLENLDDECAKLPNKDKLLLIPPASIQNRDLYDIVYLIKFGRSNGKELFSKLLLAYFELDRELRVSATISGRFFFLRVLLGRCALSILIL